MRESEPGTVRQEAERLVATAVAAAQVAAGAAAARFGDPACCVCPVCRALAAVRDPDPATVDRLATRAGDIAAGVANLMRSASAAWHGAGARGPVDEVWRVATHDVHTGRPKQPADDVRPSQPADEVRPSQPADEVRPKQPADDVRQSQPADEVRRTQPADDVWSAATRSTADRPGPTSDPAGVEDAWH